MQAKLALKSERYRASKKRQREAQARKGADTFQERKKETENSRESKNRVRKLDIADPRQKFHEAQRSCRGTSRINPVMRQAGPGVQRECD